MGKFSVEKGKRYERKIASILSEWSGIELVRTPDGAPEDLYADIWPIHTAVHFPLAVECKHVEGWSFDQIMHGTGEFYVWLQQAVEQAVAACAMPGDRWYWPCLVFTRNRLPDYLCMNFQQLKDCTELHSLYAFNYLTMITYNGDRFAIVGLEEFVEKIEYTKAVSALTTVYWCD